MGPAARRSEATGQSRRMKNAIAKAATAVWIGLATVCDGRALPQSLRSAPLQLLGRCDSCSSRWEGGSIYSYCEVSVLRVVHGTPQADTVVVRQRGGVVDGLAQKVSHVTTVEPGVEYFLFLHQDDSGNWAPVTKGVHPVVETPDLGEAVDGQPLDEVIRDLGGDR
jgi:hypothetical protein